MLSVWCVDQLQPYVYCVYCPVLAMYLMADVSMSSDQDDETAAALRPRHGSLLRPPAHHSQEVGQHPSGESQHVHNLTFILYTWRCVQKQGAGGPPYPMWHLEPLYVRKVTPSPSKRSVAKVQEQRSVFSSLDGDQHSLQQQMEQGQHPGVQIHLLI